MRRSPTCKKNCRTYKTKPRREFTGFTSAPTGMGSGTAALAALARGFDDAGHEAGPRVCFAVEGEERRLPEEAELILYRAMQEGLANAARHADAGTVLATLAYREDGVRLAIVDDGGGANGEALEGGFGLAGLRERVEALGGDLSAGDGSGGGFVLEIWLPVGRA